MKLKEYKNVSHKYTAEASKIGRNIALAGIGIIWIVAQDTEMTLGDSELTVPLILIACSLLVDFFQYILGGLLWIYFYRIKEKDENLNDESDIKSKSWRSNLLYVLYYIKFSLMIFAFIKLTKILLDLY